MKRRSDVQEVALSGGTGWVNGSDREGFDIYGGLAVETVQNLRLAGGGDRRLWVTGGSWVSGLQFRERSR